MSGTVLAGLMFGLMLVLMAVRIPVALSMFLVGSAGYLTLVGLTPYLNYLKATPYFLFHSTATTDYNQISNEIRYAGRFWDRLDATVGFYYLNSNLGYEERRYILAGFRRFFGGGIIDTRSFGVFGQLQFDLTDTFSLIGGARYSNEKKSADIANLTLNNLPSTLGYGGPTCGILDGFSCGIDFSDSFTWKNVTPKVGFQWQAQDWMQVYGSWTEGVRSGGYNLRNTSVTVPIARFDEENVHTFEFGFKAQPGDGRATINFAIFRTNIDNLQRELNIPDAIAGVTQLIRNTADANIFGFEIESQIALTDNLIFTGNLGRLDGDYERVFFNLNSDFVDLNGNGTQQVGPPGDAGPAEPGITDFRDTLLQIPRLSPWTWGAGLVHTLDLGSVGTLDSRFNYSHRDDNAYTDNNLGILLGADIIDASVGLTVHDRATISIYGQNLLNEVTHGGETQLPGSLGGGSFAPLNKGRVVGVELQLKL